MRTRVNDLEPRILAHMMSLESQCCTDSILSCGSVASRSPISNHSFELQLIKEMSVTIEEMVSKSEIPTVRYMNSTIGDGSSTASTNGLVYIVD
jgi:hypothetical protein